MLKRVIAAVLTLLLAAGPTWAAITYDTTSGQSNDGTTSATVAATIAADANIVIVCVGMREAGGAVQAATGVTVGGNAATQVTGGGVSVGNVMRTEMWYYLAPPTGSVSVVATAHASTDFTIAGVMAFKGVAQSSTFNGNATTASSVGSTDADVDNIPSAVGEMGVYCGAVRTPTGTDPTVNADATSPVSTERFEEVTATDNAAIGFGYTEAGASDLDMRVDLGNSQQWTAVAVSMLPAADARRVISPIFR